MTNFEIINPLEKHASWHDEVLKPFTWAFLNTHVHVDTIAIDLDLDKISICYNDSYSNRTWVEALENLKRFKIKPDMPRFLKETVIDAYMVDNDIIIFDHHRPIIARFMGLSTINANLKVYERTRAIE